MVIPVGHLRGVAHQHTTRHYSLRLGDELVGLSLDEFVVWSHAHGIEPHVREQAWTRETITSVVDGNLGEPVSEVIDRLTGYGVLAEVRPDAESEMAFARRHRVLPLMLGLGNTVNAPWLYRIGLPNTVASTVLADIYELWGGQHLGETLWAACQALAGEASADRHAVTRDMGLDQNGPADLLHQFLGELHCLLTANCLYVDVVPAQGASNAG